MQATTLLELDTGLECVDTFQGLWREAEYDIRHRSTITDRGDIDVCSSMRY